MQHWWDDDWQKIVKEMDKNSQSDHKKLHMDCNYMQLTCKTYKCCKSIRHKLTTSVLQKELCIIYHCLSLWTFWDWPNTQNHIESDKLQKQDFGNLRVCSKRHCCWFANLLLRLEEHCWLFIIQLTSRRVVVQSVEALHHKTGGSGFDLQ
jgi:hypothetical protein